MDWQLGISEETLGVYDDDNRLVRYGNWGCEYGWMHVVRDVWTLEMGIMLTPL